MLTFFVVFAAVYGVCVLAVTIPYWYERVNSPSGDIPGPSYSPRHVFRLWLEAVISSLLLGGAILVHPLARGLRKKPDPANALPPVLMVHGLYHDASGWIFLRRHLSRAGFGKLHAMSYSSFRTDIATVTGKLEKAVSDLEAMYPGQKPLLVGHSLGGLIIRNWLADPANQHRTLGALTLGTPHGGSKLAGLAFGRLGRSLLPDNPFFADLARREAPAAIPCLAYVSEVDTMVLPQDNLVPVTPGWTMRLAPYSSHAGILVSGPVMRMAAWDLYRMASETAADKGGPNV